MKQLKGISTEEKILEASKEVFMKNGFCGERMQDIADAAHINKALFHLINLQSLCSYPFLAAPLFKHIIKGNNKDWNGFNSNKLKQSVKSFAGNTLTK